MEAMSGKRMKKGGWRDGTLETFRGQGDRDRWRMRYGMCERLDLSPSKHLWVRQHSG